MQLEVSLAITFAARLWILPIRTEGVCMNKRRLIHKIISGARLLALVVLPLWAFHAYYGATYTQADSSRDSARFTELARQISKETGRLERRGGSELAAHVLSTHTQFSADELIAREVNLKRTAPAAFAAYVTSQNITDVMNLMADGESVGDVILGSNADLRQARQVMKAALIGLRLNTRNAKKGLIDSDGDGVPNVLDRDVDGDEIFNAEDGDIDGDGLVNALDDDVDGDGMLNGQDDDVDGDGISNLSDVDIDSDGLNQLIDDDDDGDGIKDIEDGDADGDGLNDDDNVLTPQKHGDDDDDDDRNGNGNENGNGNGNGNRNGNDNGNGNRNGNDNGNRNGNGNGNGNRNGNDNGNRNGNGNGNGNANGNGNGNGNANGNGNGNGNGNTNGNGNGTSSGITFKGRIEAMPSQGLIGSWVVEGRTVIVTDGTRFKQKKGRVGIGVRVKVQGRVSSGPITAKKIVVL